MSQYSYTQHKAIVHSRDSSVASGTSSSSRTSAEAYYSSSSSRTSMANGFNPADGLQYRRVPDNGLCTLTQTRLTKAKYSTSEDKYITSKTSTTSRGTIEVHNHRKARHTSDEPRASNATYEDYKETQRKQQRK
ncbi:uncharacterized protein K444DRAFT_232879 [Hyaloscypha bicolor E]|uniref:Uncharacterized protein n=1 Tax=Hyaloscypha bicolor E TaxID=1095630 RepID=A0A2J6SL07_9HELO|nr:uncharacterized protein K444DRAFT_232879 [Hyaloscypha bicolor E]PMD51461.1 hypothetical protein K444DRAFT_232879 [Hyaloscypha bicolor E]